MDSGDARLRESLVDQLYGGGRIFLTGAAGVGKTYLLKKVVNDLRRKRQCDVVVTASTGLAAAHLFDLINEKDDEEDDTDEFKRLMCGDVMGPSTLHSAARLPFDTNPDVPEMVMSGANRLAAADIIIVDEISMIDALTFSRFMKRVNPKHGVLLVGDFFQLPPVRAGSDGHPSYAFRSDEFAKFRVVELSKVYRQDEPDFVDFLGRMRRGDVDTNFYGEVNGNFDTNHPVLFGTRAEVAQHNFLEMSKLTTEFERTDCIVTSGKYAAACEWLDQQTNASSCLDLKKNMRVLCVRNHGSLVNGDLGTVVDWEYENDSKDKLRRVNIKSDRLGPVSVDRAIFSRRDIGGGSRFSVKQFPLVPAYGLTVHKAQGMSLDLVNIDGTRVNFAAGQVYVAMSRCRTKSGLRVQNHHYFHAFTRPDVEEYYAGANRFCVED